VTTSVSVIVPTYNSAHFLSAAIQSVLAQSYRDFELIVVDDGSRDHTPRVVASFGDRVRYLRQENAGVSVARNRGIAESSGRYVAFLDADDTWMPSKLQRQRDALEAEPTRRLCYSAFEVVDEKLSAIEIRRSRRQGSALEDLLTRGNVVGSICTVMCERALIDEVGGFDVTLSQCADWDLWIRIAARTEFIYLDEPLATYRQHGQSMSRQVRLLENDSLRLLEKGFGLPGIEPALARRRRHAFARNYMVLAGSHFGTGAYGAFLRCAALAIALDPRQFAYLAAFPRRRMKLSASADR
jgi:glycosyltransferase involved in cell wall biosynthesis